MIFSDNYTVHELHSLESKNKIGEYSEMPWSYTPLVDEMYAPTTLTTSIKNTLNQFFQYEYFFRNEEVIKNEFKHLGIYHDGDNIQEYESRGLYRYCMWNDDRNHFTQQTNTEHLEEVYQRVNKIVDATPRGHTIFRGMQYDNQAVAKSVKVRDQIYDLSSYDNKMLQTLNEYSRRNYAFCGGTINVGLGNKISFRSDFDYPERFAVVSADEFRKKPSVALESVITPSNRQAVERHLYGYEYYDLLSTDQVEYVYDTVFNGRKDARIQIEHVFDGSELVDIILYRTLYEEFELIEKELNWNGEEVIFYEPPTKWDS